jgi:hypothetical protein
LAGRITSAFARLRRDKPGAPLFCPRLSNNQPVGQVQGYCRTQFFIKNQGGQPFSVRKSGHTYCILLTTKMNNYQNSQPVIKLPINGEGEVNPLIAKLRRKLGLTYIVDNPFQVPVALSTAARESATAKKAKNKSI